MPRVRTPSGRFTDEDVAGAIKAAHDASTQVAITSAALRSHVTDCDRDRKELREDLQRRDDHAERSRAALHKKIDDATNTIQELSGQVQAERTERAKKSAENGWDIVKRFAWIVVALAVGAVGTLIAKGGH